MWLSCGIFIHETAVGPQTHRASTHQAPGSSEKVTAGHHLVVVEAPLVARGDRRDRRRTRQPPSRSVPDRRDWAALSSGWAERVDELLATRDLGRDQRSHDEPGPIRKMDCRRPAEAGVVKFRQEESGRRAHNLKTVVRKDLWVRVPRPPLIRDERGRHGMKSCSRGAHRRSRKQWLPVPFWPAR
jgi:hypothetical protein